MLRQRLNRLVVLLFLLAAGAALRAPRAAAQDGPIQDNSFLAEEAYNQEPGVMQTILTFSRVRGSGEWLSTLTQEFPAPGITHQLSYTLPLERNEVGARGVGDLALNYRYQLLGDGAAKVACSPRLSLLVPTGDDGRGLGSGGWGLDVTIPLSVVLAPSLVSHTDLGYSAVFGARAGDDRSFLAGQSLVWLAHPNANLLLEAVVEHGDGGRDGDRHTEITLSPGVRFAINVPGGLQIVPGIAFPFGVGRTWGERSVFLYLSFEHPFRKLPK